MGEESLRPAGLGQCCEFYSVLRHGRLRKELVSRPSLPQVTEENLVLGKVGDGQSMFTWRRPFSDNDGDFADGGECAEYSWSLQSGCDGTDVWRSKCSRHWPTGQYSCSTRHRGWQLFHSRFRCNRHWPLLDGELNSTLLTLVVLIACYSDTFMLLWIQRSPQTTLLAPALS